LASHSALEPETPPSFSPWLHYAKQPSPFRSRRVAPSLPPIHRPAPELSVHEMNAKMAELAHDRRAVCATSTPPPSTALPAISSLAGPVGNLPPVPVPVPSEASGFGRESRERQRVSGSEVEQPASTEPSVAAPPPRGIATGTGRARAVLTRILAADVEPSDPLHHGVHRTDDTEVHSDGSRSQSARNLPAADDTEVHSDGSTLAGEAEGNLEGNLEGGAEGSVQGEAEVCTQEPPPEALDTLSKAESMGPSLAPSLAAEPQVTKQAPADLSPRESAPGSLERVALPPPSGSVSAAVDQGALMYQCGEADHQSGTDYDGGREAPHAITSHTDPISTVFHRYDREGSNRLRLDELVAALNDLLDLAADGAQLEDVLWMLPGKGPSDSIELDEFEQVVRTVQRAQEQRASPPSRHQSEWAHATGAPAAQTQDRAPHTVEGVSPVVVPARAPPPATDLAGVLPPDLQALWSAVQGHGDATPP